MDISLTPENDLESVATAMLRAASESQRKRDMRSQNENTNVDPIYDVPVISCEACELMCENTDDLQAHRVNSCPHNHKKTEETAPSNDEIAPSTEKTVSLSTEILARFCVDAPSVEVRNCIRQYNENYSYKQQTTSFNTFSKQIIIDTLIFLGNNKKWNDHLKSVCVRELIYRIQCLLPEECGICKESYTINKNDPCLLSCRVCHQEVHKECYLPFLKTDTNDELLSEAIMKIPGFHFLCPSCEDNLIPKQDDGLKKAVLKESESSSEAPPASVRQVVAPNKSNSNDAINKNKNNCNEDDASIISHSNKRPAKPSKSHPCPLETVVEVKNTPADENAVKATPKVCDRYRNNICEFGIKGKECKFLHPKRCTKLMKHGTKAGRGCNLGKQCPDFHPKMCSTSIAKLQCFDNKCKLCHVKGTVRKKETKPSNEDSTTSVKSNGKNMSVEGADTHPTKTFLEEDTLLKRQIQEAVEMKISALLNLPPIPQALYNPKMHYPNMMPYQQHTHFKPWMQPDYQLQQQLQWMQAMWQPYHQSQVSPIPQVQLRNMYPQF